MTSTITGASPHTPAQILGYRTSRRGRNVVQELAASEDLAVTLRPAGLRSGTLRALFLTEAPARSLEAELAAAQTLTFETDELSAADMTFVLDGTIDVELDPTTRRRWIVAFDFQEV